LPAHHASGLVEFADRLIWGSQIQGRNCARVDEILSARAFLLAGVILVVQDHLGEGQGLKLGLHRARAHVDEGIAPGVVPETGFPEPR